VVEIWLKALQCCSELRKASHVKELVVVMSFSRQQYVALFLKPLRLLRRIRGIAARTSPSP
jgi:hypothetical protein